MSIEDQLTTQEDKERIAKEKVKNTLIKDVDNEIKRYKTLFEISKVFIPIRLKNQESKLRKSGKLDQALNSKFLERPKPWIETGVQQMENYISKAKDM